MVEFEMRLGVGTEMLVVDFVWFLCPYCMNTRFFFRRQSYRKVEGGQSNCLQTL